MLFIIAIVFIGEAPAGEGFANGIGWRHKQPMPSDSIRKHIVYVWSTDKNTPILSIEQMIKFYVYERYWFSIWCDPDFSENNTWDNLIIVFVRNDIVEIPIYEYKTPLSDKVCKEVLPSVYAYIVKDKGKKPVLSFNGIGLELEFTGTVLNSRPQNVRDSRKVWFYFTRNQNFR
jgi:hypothetical protein